MNRTIIKSFKDRLGTDFKLRISFTSNAKFTVEIYFDNPKIKKSNRWFSGIMGIELNWDKSEAVINDFRLNYANDRFSYYYGASIYKRGIGTEILKIVEDFLKYQGIKKIGSYSPLLSYRT